MSLRSEIPAGFARVQAEGSTLIAHEAVLSALTELGFQTPEGWSRELDSAAGGSGRGRAGSLQVHGASLVLKQMRRGGALGPLWRDRFAGRRRLLDNLIVPLEVARRGIATAEPIALLLAPGPWGFYRGWLATRRLQDTADLACRMANPDRDTLTASQFRTVVALVRQMHDAGVEHPDLNLGNLLLRDGPSGSEAYVVDLDRARLHDGPLSFARRQRALRRLERSFLKLFGGAGAPDWYQLYAAGDADLAEGFRRGRPVGRLLQRLHRLGWRV